MKRFLVGLILGLFFVGSALAAGTVTQSDAEIYGGVRLLTFTCTADASDGSFPATASDGDIDGYVFLVVTNPGATAPTDNYDITLTDGDSVDVMGGELADRDTANSEHAVPLIDAVFGTRFVDGPLTVNISNNSVNSAIVVVKVFYYR